MIIMLLLFFGIIYGGSWWQAHQADSTGGGYPTSQIDAVVGHNSDSQSNPSYFIAINRHRHIVITEWPAGDATKAKTYTGSLTLMGDGQDLAPITLSFRDVNGDGRPDMIITVGAQGQGGNIIQMVMINDGTGFRSLKPGEQIHL
jgi:hypothetical protein